MRTTPAAVTRLLASLLVLAAVVITSPGSVAAHTDFDYSLPTDGASVGEPVGEITVAFTLPVTLVGNGFEVLDPQENLLMPFAVTDDDTVFRLQFDPPLGGGAVGVRYTVTAEDGHVLSGSFSFTVSVDAPPPATTTSTAAPTTTPPPTESSPAAAEPSTTAAAAAPVGSGPVPDGAAESTAAPATTPAAAGDEAAADDADEAAAGDAGDDDGDAGGDDGDDSSSNSGPVIVIAVVVAVAAAAFVLLRSRRSANS